MYPKCANIIWLLAETTVKTGSEVDKRNWKYDECREKTRDKIEYRGKLNLNRMQEKLNK